MVDGCSPRAHCGVSSRIIHVIRSMDRERAMGFIMNEYTGCSFPTSHRWNTLECDGHVVQVKHTI